MNRITALFALALLLGPFAMPARGVDIGQDGGIELTVSFEVDPDLDGSFPAPVADPLAQAHYCAAFQELSRALYATTEGTHWIRRVRFFENANQRDIRWHYREDATVSRASYLSYMKIRENGKAEGAPDPYNPPDHSPAGLGGLLNHELGHFFYSLPDEYINLPGSQSGHTGFCADGSYSVVGDEGQGTTCDEEAFQCGGAVCVLENQCILGDQPPGTACAADGDCGSGGVCLAADEGRAEQVDKLRLCLHDTDLSDDTGDDSLGVCLMAGGGLRKRWCDGGTTASGNKKTGATHVHTLDDAQDYGVDVAFDLGDGAGVPDGADGGTDYVAFNCWDSAAKAHIDLDGVHTIGTYPAIEVIEADKGMVPTVACEWLVDGLGSGSHALLLVDRSGSMDYQDLSDPPVAAVDLALDGALYFYNQVDDGDWVGVSVFNTMVDPAISDGTPLLFGVKTGDIDSIDPVVAVDGTDIASAIDDAVSEIVGLGAGAPQANRNIVLFTDGKFNTGGDPFAAAEAACDANISVNTISYGDADSDALTQLADCGTAWVTGTELAVDGGFAEPDPLEIKSAVARMEHHLAEDDELFEHRDYLAPLGPGGSNEEMTFRVPEASPELTFTWLGNRTCARYDDPIICDPVLNLITRAYLVAPDGQIYTSFGSAAEAAGVYRSITVANPLPGIWRAGLDKHEPALPFFPADEWTVKVPATRVSWLAFVSNPSLEGRAWVVLRRGPLDYPVVINGEMYAGIVATGAKMSARVTWRGQVWNVPMLDDGEHGDGVAGDGLYGGLFDVSGTGNGNYRVKVRMSTESGLATGVPAADSDQELAFAEPIPRPFLAVVEAETSFRLSNRYGYRRDGQPNAGFFNLVCPNLVRGATADLSANVTGFAIAADDARLSLGADVGLGAIKWTCQSCQQLGADPSSFLTFQATPAVDAELGYRPVRVQVGAEVLESQNLCRVCASPGCSEIELAVEPPISGAPTALTVTGATAGEPVSFVATRAGTGSGPCPPALGGLCLDLLSPRLVGSAVTDALGRAELVLDLPALPPGPLAFQAVVRRGPGGIDSVKSDAVETVIEP